MTGLLRLRRALRQIILSESLQTVGEISWLKQVNQDTFLKMNVEDKSDRDVGVGVRPSSVGSGTFSIESILKSGAFRCVQPQIPTNFQNFPGFRQHSFTDQVVKKEHLEDDGEQGRLESPLSLPCSSMTSDTAHCQDESGTDDENNSQ